MIKIEPLDNFLDIIKSRVLKALPQTIVYRTSMIVTTPIENNSKAKVMIPGDSAEYTLLNKTGEFLFSGDSVVVESTGTNLNNGLIVHKFGITIILEELQYPILLNSWVDYNTSIYPATSYYKKDERVYVRGLVKSGTINSPIFVLPVGYRPSGQLILPIVSNSAFGELRVSANGEVTATIGNNTWVSLGEISFRIN